jgi:hypothetical protein
VGIFPVLLLILPMWNVSATSGFWKASNRNLKRLSVSVVAPRKAFAWIGQRVQMQAPFLAYIDVFWTLMLSAFAVPLALILREIKLGASVSNWTLTTSIRSESLRSALMCCPECRCAGALGADVAARATGST